MPGYTHRSTLTAVSAVLALCTAAVVTGCATSGTGTPAAIASGTSTPGAISSVTATPLPTKGVESTTPAPPPGASAAEAGPVGTPTPTPTPTSLPPGASPPKALPSEAGAPTAPKPPVAAPSPAAPSSTADAPALTPAVQPAGLAQLPIAPKFEWKPDGPLSSQDVSGRKITLNECASIVGAVTWQQQGYRTATGNPAGQQLFSFPAPEAAHAAYQQLLADMDDCQESSRQLQAREAVPRDATVTRTATTSDGTSWSRQWTGVGGLSAPDQQTNHLYALQQGAVLTLFQFDELKERPAPAHDAGTDPSVLAALAALGAQH
ncbi:hypothetical protein [Kitasatospora purpeofusca]|uniref:PknH-like extracellular domain-containing protein n=1 Tax=Kitasatospora purpeofusca TaxID=67352 RepID=A0ABZ1TTR2_9ACTN|nr:hypothetical protein [Kitasatospora purpeofusca]